jgi:hypothetical protein
MVQLLLVLPLRPGTPGWRSLFPIVGGMIVSLCCRAFLGGLFEYA